MPNLFSKFIDKAKPRFSLHHHTKNDDSSSVEHHKSGKLSSSLPIASNLTTHLFGYRDNMKDNYVEPPPGNDNFIFHFSFDNA